MHYNKLIYSNSEIIFLINGKNQLLLRETKNNNNNNSKQLDKNPSIKPQRGSDPQTCYRHAMFVHSI